MRSLSWLSWSIAILAVTSAFADDQVHWQTNLESAQRVAAESHRLVLVHFSAGYCAPCKALEQEVFSRPETARALEANFVPVKLDVQVSPATAKRYDVPSIPYDVVISPSGQVVFKGHCPPSAEQYAGQLSQVADAFNRPQWAANGQLSQAQTAQNQLGQSQQGANASGSSSPAATPSCYIDDRAGYDNRGSVPGQAAAGATNQPPNQACFQPPVAQAPSIRAAAYGAPIQSGAPAQQLAAQPPHNAQSPMAGAAGQSPPVSAAQANPRGIVLPPGSPPLGLDGYCPVRLVESKKEWVVGDLRWGAVHSGRTYLFSGPEEQKRFLANPDAYSPVISGNDPVLALDQHQAVPGRREHGVFFANQVYLFAGEASLQQFNQNPNRYAAAIRQAMR